MTPADWIVAIAVGVPTGLYCCHLLNKYVNPRVDDWAERATDWLAIKLRIKK